MSFDETWVTQKRQSQDSKTGLSDPDSSCLPTTSCGAQAWSRTPLLETALHDG